MTASRFVVLVLWPEKSVTTALMRFEFIERDPAGFDDCQKFKVGISSALAG
jgi:hypothetical protein